MERKEERKQEKATKKKVYKKPCIVHQQSLEVVAGVCSPDPKLAEPFCSLPAGG